MNKHLTRIDSPPLAVGTGLLALDIVVSEAKDAPERHWAGGTCGNVLIALCYLGWETAPIARLKAGAAAARLLADLKRWDVSSKFVNLGEDGSTPVIIERIGRTLTGEPFHTFSWRCPNCGARLPSYKPVLATTAEGLVEKINAPCVFFFDRLSRGAIVLARACANRGALIVFEPCSVGNPVLFREAWEIAHVVKYSHERLQDLPPDVEATKGIRLQIETLGGDGLRYRTRLPGCQSKAWQKVDAFAADRVRDTAGAGDWCTAGVLDKIARRGAADFGAATDAEVHDAIRYGQALAAWTCGYEGARGGMYAVEKPEFERQVAALLGASTLTNSNHIAELLRPQVLLASLCPSCEHPKNGVSRPRRTASRISV